MVRRIKFIEQMQQTECGICCTAMVLNYHKCNVDINNLRIENDVGREGSSILQVKQLLEKYGMSAAVFETIPDGLQEVNLPAIIYWENQHFVILTKITKKKATVVDPALGTITYSREEFDESYSSYVITCYPTSDMVTLEKRKSVWREFLPIVKKNKWTYLSLLFFSIATYVGSIGFPILIQKFIDATSKEQFYQKIYLVAFVSVVYVIFELAKNFQMINLQANMDEDVNRTMFHKMLSLPFKYFDLRNKSDVLISLNSGMVIRDAFIHQFISGIVECGAVISVMIYMFMENVLLASIATLFFVLLFCLIYFMQFTLKDKGMSFIVSQKKVQELQTETIFSMLNVKMTSLEEQIYNLWSERFSKYKKQYKNREYYGMILTVLSFAIVTIVPVVILVIGLLLVWEGELTIGKTMAFYALSETFLSLAGSVCGMVMSLINSSLYLDRIADVMRADEQEVNRDGEVPKLSGKIELRDINFQYSANAEPVIKNISLSIKPGEKVAIVGKSGSGKSTLAKLIVGLYMPSSGKILFDGKAEEELNMIEIRKQMGIVPQEVNLFNKSIYENIVSERQDVTMEQVIEACQMVGIHQDIDNMALKYNTIISEMGCNLSGGQRQRIALARALIGKPRILILDEATSSLDNIYEKGISDYLDKMDVTQVIIAHRLSTICGADKIIVMDEGKIVEQGTHEKLLKKNGFYRKLYDPE